MIVFDLKCGGGHVFEAWFGSSAAYAEQVAAGLVHCPVCDDAAVTKAVMAPAVPTKGNRREAVTPQAIKAVLQKLAAQQTEALRSSEYVATGFAGRARAMHLGDEAPATIHGPASLAEAKALVDEGVAIAPLPFPVVPPEMSN